MKCTGTPTLYTHILLAQLPENAGAKWIKGSLTPALECSGGPCTNHKYGNITYYFFQPWYEGGDFLTALPSVAPHFSECTAWIVVVPSYSCTACSWLSVIYLWTKKWHVGINSAKYCMTKIISLIIIQKDVIIYSFELRWHFGISQE